MTEEETQICLSVVGEATSSSSSVVAVVVTFCALFFLFSASIPVSRSLFSWFGGRSMCEDSGTCFF